MNKNNKTGCCSNPFQKDWEVGHDPLKPWIEKQDKNGNKTQVRPCSKVYDLVEMKDEEIGDFLDEEERKYIKMLKKQRKEIGNRDLCKEHHEAKDKIIEEQNSKITELQNIIIEHNKLLSQIVDKIKNI